MKNSYAHVDNSQAIHTITPANSRLNSFSHNRAILHAGQTLDAHNESGLQRALVYDEPNSRARFEVNCEYIDMLSGYDEPWIEGRYFQSSRGFVVRVVYCSTSPTLCNGFFFIVLKEQVGRKMDPT